MILAATLVFLFGLIVIRALHSYATIVTVILSAVAIGLFCSFAEMAGGQYSDRGTALGSGAGHGRGLISLSAAL